MSITDNLPQWLDRLTTVSQGELLTATVLAILAGWIGTMLVRRRVPFGRLLSLAGTLTLAAILLTVVLQISSLDPRMGFVRSGIGADPQVVAGGETQVKLARDGHFWINAKVNGAQAAFLVDTGATLTAVSADLAQRAGLQPRNNAVPVRIVTANGPVAAEVTRIDDLTFGNIAASDIDAVIAPSLGDTNVLGMNFLSRLDGWQVKGDTLILSPAAGDTAE